MQTSASAQAVTSLLPKGQTLPPSVFEIRHRWITRLLWMHVVGLPIFGIARDYQVLHALLEALPLLVLALAATFARGRRLRASLTAIGLLTSSAILVHLWDGAIEAHFHFFLMIPVLALYEDWLPFLLSVAYVAVHHGAAGAIQPEAVYNHTSAQEHPWRWAAIHGIFVAGASAIAIASWRFNEQMRAQAGREMGKRAEAEAVAAALSRSLRPDVLPPLAHGTVAARYLPAGTRDIGGDWYDVLELPDGRVVLTLGDVAGHGVLAASEMAGLRHSVRTYAREGLSPLEVTERVHRFFRGEFATFLYLVYEPEGDELRFANAGHVPPVLAPPGEEPRLLTESRSYPLGLGEHAAIEEGVVDFQPGSLVVIYTDGLVERRDAALGQQLERLRALVGDCERDAEAVCDCVISAFPPEGADDVALLAFRAGGGGGGELSAEDSYARAL
ncbi:MAG TPA: PP2C family protein-serine/threonine phosphatase [Thermoleophilaceae bacterium]|jgi:hypothetical protein